MQSETRFFYTLKNRGHSGLTLAFDDRGSTSEPNKDSGSCENLHQDKKQKESLALFHVLIKCQNDATNSDGDFVEALPRGEVGLSRPHQPVEAAGGVAGAALDPPLGSYPRGARGDVWRKKGQNSHFPIDGTSSFSPPIHLRASRARGCRRRLRNPNFRAPAARTRSLGRTWSAKCRRNESAETIPST